MKQDDNIRSHRNGSGGVPETGTKTAGRFDTILAVIRPVVGNELSVVRGDGVDERVLGGARYVSPEIVVDLPRSMPYTRQVSLDHRHSRRPAGLARGLVHVRESQRGAGSHQPDRQESGRSCEGSLDQVTISRGQCFVISVLLKVEVIGYGISIAREVSLKRP
jgi:hypothetical protein